MNLQMGYENYENLLKPLKHREVEVTLTNGTVLGGNVKDVEDTEIVIWACQTMTVDLTPERDGPGDGRLTVQTHYDAHICIADIETLEVL